MSATTAPASPAAAASAAAIASSSETEASQTSAGGLATLVARISPLVASTRTSLKPVFVSVPTDSTLARLRSVARLARPPSTEVSATVTASRGAVTVGAGAVLVSIQ